MSSSDSPHKKTENGEREKDRHRHHRDRPRKVNIGVQCRRDKNLEKTVGFSPPANSDPPQNSFSANFGFCMGNIMPSLSGKYKYGYLMKIETCANGLGKVLHMWQKEIDGLNLVEAEMERLAKDYITETFKENEDGYAYYCCSVVHGAATYLPDFLEYLGSEHCNMTIKHGIIGQPRELETTVMANYREKVAENYKAGTFRFGHLDNVSLVGTVAEESGGYIPDVIDMLEESPFLRYSKIKMCGVMITWHL